MTTRHDQQYHYRRSDVEILLRSVAQVAVNEGCDRPIVNSVNQGPFLRCLVGELANPLERIDVLLVPTVRATAPLFCADS